MKQERLEQARLALVSDPRIGARANGVTLRAEDAGAVLIEGEVESLTVKRLALYQLAGAAGAANLVDRLQVRPASPMSDLEIADHVCHSLVEEPVFGECSLVNACGPERIAQRDAAPGARGLIDVSVQGAVVTLAGAVPSLSHKRMAGVLAWWVPGTRNVVNALAVEPPEEDSAHEIADAVRLVLEKDPFLDAAQIRISAAQRAVTLEGAVPSEAQREMAELDTWYIHGVELVDNRITILD